MGKLDLSRKQRSKPTGFLSRSDLSKATVILYTESMRTEKKITRTATADEITYSIKIDGQVASFLTITAEHRVVANVETVETHQRQGLARALWQAANAEATVLHQQDHHRTFEGDAYALAMGGETADETTDYCEHCIICTGDDDLA